MKSGSAARPWFPVHRPRTYAAGGDLHVNRRRWVTPSSTSRPPGVVAVGQAGLSASGSVRARPETAGECLTAGDGPDSVPVVAGGSGGSCGDAVPMREVLGFAAYLAQQMGPVGPGFLGAEHGRGTDPRTPRKGRTGNADRSAPPRLAGKATGRLMDCAEPSSGSRSLLQKPSAVPGLPHRRTRGPRGHAGGSSPTGSSHSRESAVEVSREDADTARLRARIAGQRGTPEESAAYGTGAGAR